MFCKILLLRFITFTGMSVACMAFELSNILISLSAYIFYTYTVWKVSVFKVFMVHIFPQLHISPYSVRMWKIRAKKTPNTDTSRSDSDRSKRKVLFSKFWNYRNSAHMFSVLNNIFQSRWSMFSVKGSKFSNFRILKVN